MQDVKSRDKIKKTKFDRYGNENYVNIDQCKKTCLEKYGDENYRNKTKAIKTCLDRYGVEHYNNTKKTKQTCLEKYGVANSFQLSTSNKTRITKPTRKIKSYIEQFISSEFEHYIPELGIKVDIYIPSINTVIEHLGDFWHMNPNKYGSSDYNKVTHKTAQQHWENDRIRREKLKDVGYKTLFIWESDVKNDSFKKIINEHLFMD
jgi:G:T-mismatch repair DNA endonuclease (very short patch repair protein)